MPSRAENLNKRIEDAWTSLLENAAVFIAIPIYMMEWFKRHDKIRKWLIRLGTLTGLTLWIFGPQGMAFIMALGSFAAGLLYAVGFMVIQFGALFWFMSRTRLIEVHPGDAKAVTFDDYWGQKTLVANVRHWNKLLSQRDRFEAMGGKALNGIMLVGPPGTGKTWLAKAMAGDEGVGFIGTEGSSFRAMFWGVDTMKMMAFVAKARTIAKRYGACIAYIDEIDAVAQSRSGVMGGAGGGGQVIGGGGGGGLMGGGGQSGALTRLLYEMDGLDEIPEFDIAKNRALKLLGLPMIFQGQVMFMGATNRPDTVDPALLRPGRFDQTIIVDIPDEGSRREVIKGYLGRITHDDDVDVEILVANTAGATPALIMSVITKMSVRNAIFEDHDSVSQNDLEMAFLEKMVGLQSPIENWDPEEKKSVAIHESGHVIAMRYLRPHKHVAWVSIVRRGQALGFALDLNPSDVYAYPVRHWKQDILVSLAGNAAVEMLMGEEWTGMGGDMMKVRNLVGALISQGVFTNSDGMRMYPIADPTSFNGGGGSPELTKAIDRFMNSANESIRTLLGQHRPALELLWGRLFDAEDLTGAAAFAIMDEAEPVEETA